MIRSSLLVLSLSLSATPAFASPKLGDHVEYTANVTDAGKTTVASVILELVQAEGTKFLQRTTVAYPTQAPKVTDEWKETKDLLSDADIDDAIKTCKKMETLVVPAGTFNACANDFDEADAKGTEWIAKVPFGTVRISYVLKANNKAVDMQLKSFK